MDDLIDLACVSCVGSVLSNIQILHNISPRHMQDLDNLDRDLPHV